MSNQDPADKIHHVNPQDLKPLPSNARVHSEEQIKAIADIIKSKGWTVPVLIDEENMIIAGHGRIEAAKLLDRETVPAVIARGWTDEKKRSYALEDNLSYEMGDWDGDAFKLEYEFLEDTDYDLSDTDLSLDLDFLDETEEDESEEPELKVTLADRFGVPPFTILNAREGWWQNRKRAWLRIGIKSELGRGDNLLKFSDSISLDGKAYQERFSDNGKKNKKEHNGHLNDAGKKALGAYAAYGNAGVIPRKKSKAKAYGTTDWIKEKGLSGGAQDVAGGSGTSIFDPVLCELSYSWFCPKNGRILDPFSGGSVRGVVAAAMGRQYTGIDLSQDQIDANKAQYEEISKNHDLAPVTWHQGDSAKLDEILGDEKDFDFLYSCPPYADLEVYSDEESDISNMPYEEFLKAYYIIIQKAVDKLADNSFACFVTGDARGKDGNYYGLPEDTVKAFEAAGMRKYNEAILVTATGSLAIRITKQFNASRKMGKTHQNVTVFLKGNAKKAVAKLDAPDFGKIEDIEDETGGLEIDE